MMRRSVAQRVSSWRLESWSLRSTDDTCVSMVFTESCELAGHLLVRVAAGDQAQHLALAGRELVELGVDGRGHRAGERVEHEAGEPGENAASPAATRATASARSAPEIDFVT